MKAIAYPDYKDSGVGWLGNVPTDWKVKRLKYLASINDDVLSETTPPDYEFSYVDISSVDPIYGIISKEEMIFENAPSRARRIVRKGDIIISTVRTYLKAIAQIKNLEENLIVSTGFAVVRPQSINHDFLSYALKESGFIQTIVARSTGVSYPATNASEVGTISIPTPSPAEQQNIANYLDFKTLKIDKLIEKKQALIEKLQEKRTVLISKTVTLGLPPDAARAAGLDPNPRLKPSGIDWLGDVPEHWSVRAIKWESPVFRGQSPRPIDDPIYFDDDGEYSWVRISDVTASGMYLLQTEQKLSKIGSSFSIKLQSDTLFVSIAGSVGKPCITKIKCCIHDGFVYFPRFKGENRFLYYIFASGEPYKGLGKLGTQLNLNTDTIGSIVIGVPEQNEQIAIADYLDQETAKIDKMISTIAAAIDRLQEYRISLITAAVTGKIDVRGATT